MQFDFGQRRMSCNPEYGMLKHLYSIKGFGCDVVSCHVIASISFAAHLLSSLFERHPVKRRTQCIGVHLHPRTSHVVISPYSHFLGLWKCRIEILDRQSTFRERRFAGSSVSQTIKVFLQGHIKKQVNFKKKS